MPRITFNGREYDSVDDMPPDMRRAYQRLMGVFADENGDGMPDIFEFAGQSQQYGSADEMPPEARKLYDQMIGMAPGDGFASDGFRAGTDPFRSAASSSVNVVVTQGGIRRAKRRSPAGLLIGLALIALFAGGGLALFNVIFRSSDSYDIAFARARASPEVLAVFGEPLSAGWWTAGKISGGGASTTARYQLPISGPLQDGRMRISGSERAGVWNVTVIITYERGGETRTIRLDE